MLSRRMVRLTIWLAAAITCSMACAGPAARRLRPGDLTYADAVGEACASGGDPQPLIVDLRADARADLEVAMRRGVAAVVYDCKRLRVLPDCTIAGRYDFI